MKLCIPEHAVIKAVKDYLTYMERLGHVAFFTRVHAGSMQKRYVNRKGQAKEHWIQMSRPGTPDFIGCLLDGHFFAIECKGTNGRLTPEQIEVERRLIAAGAEYVIARSADDVEKALFSMTEVGRK